jgi:hypothetical protein
MNDYFRGKLLHDKTVFSSIFSRFLCVFCTSAGPSEAGTRCCAKPQAVVMDKIGTPMQAGYSIKSCCFFFFVDTLFSSPRTGEVISESKIFTRSSSLPPPSCCDAAQLAPF